MELQKLQTLREAQRRSLDRNRGLLGTPNPTVYEYEVTIMTPTLNPKPDKREGYNPFLIRTIEPEVSGDLQVP